MVQLHDFTPLKRSGSDLNIPKLIRKDIIFAWRKCITQKILAVMCIIHYHILYAYVHETHRIFAWLSELIEAGAWPDLGLVLLLHDNPTTYLKNSLSSLMQTPSGPSLTIDAGDGLCLQIISF